MPVDYDAFRRMPWADRLETFNGISPSEKAQLVREHAGRWLEAHRRELDERQTRILEEAIEFVRPKLYQIPKDPALRAQSKDLERRILSLLSCDQVREALTMQWDTPCTVMLPRR
jgi:hypothetical protein